MMICLWGLWLTPAWALDSFERLTPALLTQSIAGKDPVSKVDQRGASKWKNIGKDVESPCIVVRTAEGQMAKVLLSWGFRKTEDKPMPVVLLERFVTFGKEQKGASVAHGENVMLFPGFQFDLDIGQVVPEGLGGDLEVSPKGDLQKIGPTEIFGLDGGGETEEEKPGERPATGPVAVEDFGGIWEVDGDGRWKGKWELVVRDDGSITGEFHSAETKSSYAITGRQGGVPHEVKLEIQFNATVQLAEVYLWTKDKSKLAGTFTMEGRKFGLSGVRQKISKE